MAPSLKKRRKWRAFRSTLFGVGVNAILAAIKGTAGILGNSYALIADAVESLLDIFHGLVVLGGIHIAAAEPDQNHPYGHGKAEPLAAIVAAFGILGGAGIIAFQSIEQLLHPEASGPATFTLAVILGVVVVKELMYRYVSAVGKETGSTAVQADAWHHRSDALTSLAALVGIAVSVVGGEGYESADQWAALVACGLIVFNAVRLLKPALGEIMDTAPPAEIAERVREIAEEMERVRGIDQCIVRKMGFDYFVDLHLYVDGDMSVHAGHEVAHQVKDAVMADNPYIHDVLIHIEPDYLYIAAPDENRQ